MCLQEFRVAGAPLTSARWGSDPGALTPKMLKKDPESKGWSTDPAG